MNGRHEAIALDHNELRTLHSALAAPVNAKGIRLGFKTRKAQKATDQT
jgi:hypothetical protein